MSLPPFNTDMPAAEISVDAALVRALLRERFPQFARLPIARPLEGWDNTTFRLGADLAMRLPRRAVAVPLLVNEQRWLPTLAPKLPLPTTVSLHVGAPSARFPWPWSIVPWIEGAPSDLGYPRADQAPVLAAFLRALHQPAPPEAPRNPVRGVPLSARLDVYTARLATLRERGEEMPPGVLDAWEEGLAAPIDLTDLWFHGDMHPRNVLVHDGRLSAIIDWGDIGAGDPATDIAAIWMLFETRAAREAALTAYAPTQATFLRARGWAALFAVMLRAITNNPPLPIAGAAVVARLVEGP